MKTPLDIAIHIIGGQSALAAKVGVKQANVWNWLNRQGRQPPAGKVLAVSEATDWQVTPHQLRPDIYPNPADGLPCDKASEPLSEAHSASIVAITPGMFTPFTGSGYLYSGEELGRRHEKRRHTERREEERRDHDRREAS